ncbi:MAG: DUF4505 domain-containing protein [Candidatus Kapabacteria bacterium]|nr:DUF4505 domain-containing protein [Candidatus Kapabacteria bacterium]
MASEMSQQPMKREFFYDVSDRGVLTLDGAVHDDPWFLDYAFRRLARTANPLYPDYPYVARCGDEMNFFRPADTPIVFTRFDGTDLGYAAGLTVRFQPSALAYTADGVLYHVAPVGDYGRLAPSVAMSVAERITPWGPLFAYHDEVSRAMVPLRPLDDARYEIIRPRAENMCVGCGGANPSSLRLSFVYDTADDCVRTWLVPDERMHGSLQTVHGGYVSLLLDETMGKCLSRRSIKAPTASLQVNFRRPMLVHHTYNIKAWVEEIRGRKNMLRGEIRDDNTNDLVAEATALFITLKTTPSA